MTTSANLTCCITFDFDAMSSWLGSARSQNPSMISRGQFGAVAVDPASSEGFVKAVEGIIGSTERVEAMGQAAREFAAQPRFSEDPASELVSIYERVIQQKKDRTG